MIRICQRCGHEFKGRSYAKYCPDCRKIAHNEQSRIRAALKRKGLIRDYVLTCERCHKEFTSPRERKYCDKCRILVHREQNAAWKKKHPQDRTLKPVFIKRPCERCGKTIEVARNSKRRFCEECLRIRWIELGARLTKFNMTCPRTCKLCGKNFIGHLNQKRCPDCLAAERQRIQQKLQARYDAQRSKRTGKTLDDWAREASDCNLDYGTYRALIAAGRTFEQLKADRRSPQLHSHCHAVNKF